MSVSHVLVVLADTVLADNGGHRALPVRLPGLDGGFWRLLAARKTAMRNTRRTMPRR
jgi:hypothetical protein